MKNKKIVITLLAVVIFSITGIAAIASTFSNYTALKHNSSVADSTITKTYTCPMHPEVISDKPGQCPKCGMDLELKEDSNKQDSNKQEGMNHDGMKHDGKKHGCMDHGKMNDEKKDAADDHKGCNGCMGH